MNKNIQFRYVLKDAHFYCETCCDTITLKADKRGEIKKLKDDGSYECKCGATYKLPHHYVDTYHNKKVKVGTRWI